MLELKKSLVTKIRQLEMPPGRSFLCQEESGQLTIRVTRLFLSFSDLLFELYFLSPPMLLHCSLEIIKINGSFSNQVFDKFI